MDEKTVAEALVKNILDNEPTEVKDAELKETMNKIVKMTADNTKKMMHLHSIF